MSSCNCTCKCDGQERERSLSVPVINIDALVASLVDNPAFIAAILAIAGPVFDYANFYALMPPNNPAPIAIGDAIEFPNIGPARINTGITALTTSTFNLAEAGDYEIKFHSTITDDGQLAVFVNGVQDPNSVAGRSALFSHFSNIFIMRATTDNTVISVNVANGSINPVVLTPNAGGSDAVSAQLIITRLA